MAIPRNSLIGLPLQRDPLQHGDDEHQAVPVGSSNYIKDFLDGKLGDAMSSLFSLSPLIVPTRVCTLRCTCCASLCPASQCISWLPSQAQTWAKQVDDVVFACFSRVLSLPPLTEFQASMLSRPAMAGGLDFPRFERDWPMMQLHSLLLLCSLCPPSDPDANLSNSIAVAFERASVTLGKHPAHILGKPENELVNHGTHGALRRLRRWQFGMNGKSLLQMRRVWCTTLWFLQPKMSFATDQVVKTAMRQWLGLPPLTGPAPCNNVHSSTQHRRGEITDERGRHAQHCCKSQAQARHHALRNTWAAIAVECGCHVTLEHEVRLKDGHTKRADISSLASTDIGMPPMLLSPMRGQAVRPKLPNAHMPTRYVRAVLAWIDPIFQTATKWYHLSTSRVA